MTKKGIVPRHAGDYVAARPEADGNKIEVVAEAPKVFDRDSSNPESGLKRKKSDVHGHEYPGRNYKTRTVEVADAKLVDRAVIDKQLGSNLDTKVVDIGSMKEVSTNQTSGF